MQILFNFGFTEIYTNLHTTTHLTYLYFETGIQSDINKTFPHFLGVSIHTELLPK